MSAPSQMRAADGGVNQRSSSHRLGVMNKYKGRQTAARQPQAVHQRTRPSRHPAQRKSIFSPCEQYSSSSWQRYRQVATRANSSFDIFEKKVDRLVIDADRMDAIADYAKGGLAGLALVGAACELMDADLMDTTAQGCRAMVDLIASTARHQLLERYLEAAATHPFLTKAMTSGVAYTLGDMTAQSLQGTKPSGMDMSRAARSGMAGFMVHGPFCHLWINWMETNLSFGGAWWSVLAKVAADQTVWSLFLNTCYTAMILALQGRGAAAIADEVKSTCWPALSSGWQFWPFVHCISFSPFVPTDLKLLFIDSMEIVWVTRLAAVVNREDLGDAPPHMADGEASTSSSSAGVETDAEAQTRRVRAPPGSEEEEAMALSTVEMAEMGEMLLCKMQQIEKDNDGRDPVALEYLSSAVPSGVSKDDEQEEPLIRESTVTGDRAVDGEDVADEADGAASTVRRSMMA